MFNMGTQFSDVFTVSQKMTSERTKVSPDNLVSYASGRNS